ncbi:sensor histidine kinase [Actinomycetes bacterium KLBMP 9797]
MTFVHQACVYQSAAEFLAAIVPFTLDGLARDEQVLAVTTPRNIDLLAEALATDATRVEFVDAGDWYRHPITTLAKFDRYVREYGAVRVIGEPVWSGLSTRDMVEWKRYEAALNVAFAPTSAWIVCPYDARVLAPEIVADALRTHPTYVDSGGIRRNVHYVEPAAFFSDCDAAALPDPPEHAAVLPFTGDLHSARRFVSTYASAWALSPLRSGLLVAAVNEVATYLLESGRERATIRIWRDGGEVRCDLHDAGGTIRDPFLGLRPPAAGKDTDGMWLVRRVCDLVLIRSDQRGATIRIHVTIDGAGPGARGSLLDL